MRRTLSVLPFSLGLLGAIVLVERRALATSFDDDLAFLNAHTRVIVLSDKNELAKVAIVPAWQGRVMTSTSGGGQGRSHGWINRELIASKRPLPHMNAFGGEDRFWMGPEGGQFSIFFAPGARFEYPNWFTPAAFDTQPFELASQSRERAVFTAMFTLTNYSGTRFEVAVKREVSLLTSAMAWKGLGVSPAKTVELVAYESNNTITNAGTAAWKKETGLLSVWILGMFQPSPMTTVVVPIKKGPESKLGVKVTSDYFGAIPPGRIVVKDDAVFLLADGNYRSKIGIGPRRSKAILGSYGTDNGVLTIVQFSQPVGAVDYVNSLWQLQDSPYGGDVANSYNDGPPAPGAKPLGPFYELESSSPAAALAPGGTLTHVHRTFHLSGPTPALSRIAKATLGVSLNDVTSVFADSNHGPR